MASLQTGRDEVSYMPREINTKEQILQTVEVFHRIQANRDRLISIKLGLREIQVDLDKLWDHAYNIVLDREPAIASYRSIDLRERAVREVVPTLAERRAEVELLLEKCKEVLDNLHNAYFTLHAMVEAAKFGVRQLGNI